MPLQGQGSGFRPDVQRPPRVSSSPHTESTSEYPSLLRWHLNGTFVFRLKIGPNYLISLCRWRKEYKTDLLYLECATNNPYFTDFLFEDSRCHLPVGPSKTVSVARHGEVGRLPNVLRGPPTPLLPRPPRPFITVTRRDRHPPPEETPLVLRRGDSCFP